MPTTTIGNPVRLGQEVDSYAALVVSSASVALTVPATATTAVISVEDAPVRVRDDGSAPVQAADTTRRGLVLGTGSLIATDSPGRLRFIRTTTADATLSIEFRK